MAFGCDVAKRRALRPTKARGATQTMGAVLPTHTSCGFRHLVSGLDRLAWRVDFAFPDAALHVRAGHCADGAMPVKRSIGDLKLYR